MSSTEIGRKAEAHARAYLEMRGFKLLEQNWRRPRCEIDIIASKNNVIHFIEVKYRKDDNQGSGIEAINNEKLNKMRLGAWVWVDENKYRGQYTLSAIELSGPKFAVIGFIEDVY